MARFDDSKQSDPGSPDSGEDSYELADFEPPKPRQPVMPPMDEGDDELVPVEEPLQPERPRPARRPPRSERDQAALDAATVSQVWTRSAESGSSMALVAVGALLTAFVVYQAFTALQFGLGFLALLVGGLVCILLSYPIVITLERPVRITPEQAVKDFFGALSHHFPHYRRMWLLLSDTGKLRGPFGSFGEFRKYWKGQLRDWKRAAGVPNRRPLAFRVVDFDSERSAGKTSLMAKFTLQVFARGRESEPPIAEYPYEIGLVKGSDRMWYLNEGSVPD